MGFSFLGGGSGAVGGGDVVFAMQGDIIIIL